MVLEERTVRRTFKIKNPILRWFAGFTALSTFGAALLGLFYGTGKGLELFRFDKLVLGHPFGGSMSYTLEVIYFGLLAWFGVLVVFLAIYGIVGGSWLLGNRFFNQVAA